MKSHRRLRADAGRIWSAALRAADPESAIHAFVKRTGPVFRINGRRHDLRAYRHIWVLGAGKAAAPMGRAMETILGRQLAGGFLVTKYGHGMPLKTLELMEAGHPLPDANSAAAASRMIGLARDRIGPEDLVLCVFSGGASSLLVSPAPGITLDDKLACTQLLLRSGADIYALNAIRKHLSSIKGGGLARMLAPAKVISLILSDVVGDDVGTIASGPTAPDPTTFVNCLEILDRLGIFEQVPESVRERLTLGAAGEAPETPKDRDAAFEKSENHIVSSNAHACTAAAGAAKKLGYRTLVLTSRLEGDTGNAAGFHMNIAEEIAWGRRPLRRPACVLSGGETTVRVAGSGEGGRNQEFVLHCVRQLAQLPAPCVVASLGTDGTDGPTDAAGAVADNTTLSRSLKFGAQFWRESLENNDSYRFFKKLGDHIMTGPTRTNVMDLHVVLIG